VAFHPAEGRRSGGRRPARQPGAVRPTRPSRRPATSPL
jgi:hypothetical protein